MSERVNFGGGEFSRTRHEDGFCTADGWLPAAQLIGETVNLGYGYPDGFRYDLHEQIPMPYPCCGHCHHPRHPQFTGHPSPCYHCGLAELARSIAEGRDLT